MYVDSFTVLGITATLAILCVVTYLYARQRR